MASTDPMPDAQATRTAGGTASGGRHETVGWSGRLWAVLVLVATAIVTATGVYVRSADQALVASAGEGLALAAADVAEDLIHQRGTRDTTATLSNAAEAVQLLHPTPASLGWALVARDGRRLVVGGSLRLDALDPPSPMFVRGGQPGWVEGRADVPVVIGWAPIPDSGPHRRAVLLAMARSDVLAPTRIVLRTLLLASGLVIAPLLLLLYTSDRIRRRLDARVRTSRDELEARVVARTAELEAARNAALAAAQARADFFARMSHELRTPLSAVLGFADILADPVLPRDERSAHADTVRRNGEHIVRLLDDVLDLARIEAGKLPVERRWCSLTEVVGGAVASLGAAARAKGLELTVDYVRPVPEQVLVDPTRLRQILLNLVGNAVKFTREGGVRVVVRLAGPSGGRQLRIDVIDTGVGLDPETAARLFTPFTQAEASTSRRFGGSGLGLAISRQLARLLGGDVTMDSAPGRGSTFRVEIDPGPFDEAALVRASIGRPARRIATEDTRLQGRVLLAEAATDVRDLVRIQLESAGATVDVVDNGIEACLRALSGDAYGCVLLGLELPGLDGVAAAARLRAAGYAGPVVALGVAAAQGERDRCRAAGCDDVVAAPIDRAALLAVVRAQLERAGGADASLAATG